MQGQGLQAEAEKRSFHRADWLVAGRLSLVVCGHLAGPALRVTHWEGGARAGGPSAVTPKGQGQILGALVPSLAAAPAERLRKQVPSYGAPTYVCGHLCHHISGIPQDRTSQQLLNLFERSGPNCLWNCRRRRGPKRRFVMAGCVRLHCFGHVEKKQIDLRRRRHRGRTRAARRRAAQRSRQNEARRFY